MSSHTPLLAIDAIVFDTETTGLDPSSARLVEFGAVPLRRGRIDSGSGYRLLVNPGVPMPEAARRVHGIDDAALADAPSFVAAWADIAATLGGGTAIGHGIGFDLAILHAECKRAGLGGRPLVALDTRLLAQLVEPRLSDYALEQLAAWLGVEVEARHSALGDAVTTARIFQALVPRLRDLNVRTVAEARRACLGLTSAVDAQRGAGWLAPEAVEADPAPAAGFDRLDPYPYGLRCRDLMRSPPVFVTSDARLRDALGLMLETSISSVFVRGAEPSASTAAEAAGILTERDILRALGQGGASILDSPVGRFSSVPLAAVGAGEFVYRAVARMIRLGIRHLAVTDGDDVVGVLSARDLLKSRILGAQIVGDAIEAADDVGELAAAWAELPRLAAALRSGGLTGRQVAAVVSRELAAATRAAGHIATERLAGAGRGDPPCPHVLVVLGSAGRGESLLALDQDNAILFADDTPDTANDRWFGEFGAIVADVLHEIGVPYCKGGVMGRNAEWRGTMDGWRRRLAGWIRRSDPKDLLSVDIFFDMLGVEGDTRLADRVLDEAFDAASGEIEFAKLLAEAPGPVAQGLGLFGRILTENGRIDLKRSGLIGVVTAARVLAIRHHIVERSTPARLEGVLALGIGGGTDLERLLDAQATFLDLILDQQLADIAQGTPPSNAVDVGRLSRRDTERLKEALAAVRHVDRLTRDLLFAR